MKRIMNVIPLALLSSSLLAAETGTDDLDALRARISALEQQVSKNSTDISSTKSSVAQAKQQVTTLVRRTINDNASASARIDNALYGDDLSGFFKLPNTDSIMRIGGYLKMDAIYDLDPTGDPDQFLVAYLPSAGAENQFHMHAKQTRINFEIRRPTNDDMGPLRILIENDFFGPDYSTNYRLRHAFAQVNNILGGYTYSTFMDADALPNTLDFAGPGGAVFLLTPQLRFSKDLGEGTNVAFALERPAAEIDYGAGPALEANTPMPDIVARARWEAEGGHLQIGAVARQVGWSDGAGQDDTVTGIGGSISGVVKTVGDDSIQFSLTGGEGIGHYYSDLNGGTSDAGFDANGDLEALSSAGGFISYQHFWNDKWNTALVYGNLQVDNSTGQLGSALHKDEYASLNLIWNPVGSLNLGMEILQGTLEHNDGTDTTATRIQFSAQVDLMR